MSQLRRLKRGLLDNKVKVAKMLQRLTKEAGGLEELRNNFDEILDQTFRQGTREVYEPGKGVP